MSTQTVDAIQSDEVWRAIPGYEGRYEVSNLGQVRALRFRRRRFDRLRATPLILRTQVDRYGYHAVELGSGRHHTVHRLVLEAFVGPCPPGHQCAHENGVKTDNRPENLTWKTSKENAQDRDRHGTTARGDRSPYRLYPERYPRGDAHTSHLHPERMARGERVATAKLTALCVQEIRTAIAAGETQGAVAARFGVNRTTVGAVARRQTWAHVVAS